jgi:hypothetical protein
MIGSINFQTPKVNPALRLVTRLPASVSALLAALLILSVPAFGADTRPNVIAPDRYVTPLKEPVDPVEQQGAYSYRNELLSEQRRMELNAPNRTGASDLRRSGEINSEVNRIDRLLQER